MINLSNVHAAPAASKVSVNSSGSETTVGTIVAAVIVVVFTMIAVGLGVGLSVGLKPSGSTQNSSGTTQSPGNVSNCVYSSTSCGCAASKPTFQLSKIINGYPAVANSWPWMVSLYVNSGFNCGGFLAQSYQFVVTAAHCLENFDKRSVFLYAGLHTQSARASGQVRSVYNWTIHPNYTGFPAYENDIAVIKLNASFTANMNVSLCCLPSGTTQLPILNEFAVIAGWGTTISGDLTRLSNTLLQTRIQIQGTSTYCNAEATSNIQFCAGYGTSDSCQGDSGGPLMTVVNNLWTCTGIVSFGQGGCGHAGYYTRVSTYRSFLNQQFASL